MAGRLQQSAHLTRTYSDFRVLLAALIYPFPDDAFCGSCGALFNSEGISSLWWKTISAAFTKPFRLRPTFYISHIDSDHFE